MRGDVSGQECFWFLRNLDTWRWIRTAASPWRRGPDNGLLFVPPVFFLFFLRLSFECCRILRAWRVSGGRGACFSGWGLEEIWRVHLFWNCCFNWNSSFNCQNLSMNTCCSVVLSFDLAGESVSEVIPKGKIERIRTQRRYSKACSWSVQHFSTLGSFTQGLLIVQQILLQHLSQHLDMSWYSYTLKQPILRRLKHRHRLSTPIFLLIKTVSLKSQQDFPKC